MWKILFILSVFEVVCYGGRFYKFDVKGNSLHGYYISSLIGTPPQRINLLIDTGSSNLAVATSHNAQKEHFFNYNHSLTFRPTTTEVQLTYVQGFWKGFIGLDIFNPCINQPDCSIVCNISCMSFLQEIFDDNSEFQGILGLAYTSIAYPNSSVRPFLDVFFEEKNLSKKIFALSLCGPFFSSKIQSTSCGELSIGYYSHMHYRGDIVYTPIFHEWFYEITIVDFRIDQFSFPLPCKEFINKNKSIVDSGTTNLNLPLVLYNWAITKIRNYVIRSDLDHMWINESVICMHKNINTSSFPILTLSLYHSDHELFNIHVKPESYLLPMDNDSCAMLALGISNYGYGVVIGSSVLKSFFVLFDRDNKRIGFAKSSYFHNPEFVSEMSGVLSSPSNLKDCMRTEVLPDTSISAALALILVCLLFVAFCVLCPLLTWLWKHHIKKKNKMDRSDIINLVDEE